MRKLLLLSAGALLLSGCGSEQTYGISGARWVSMSPEMHKQIETEYVKTQNAIHAEGEQAKPGKHSVRVAVYGGRALMPPFDYYHPYEREVVDIQEGTCETTELDQPNGEHDVDLTLCYRDHKLEIDPSHYIYSKRHGTVALQESPTWKDGFTYKHVTSSGFARLKNAHIYVKRLS